MECFDASRLLSTQPMLPRGVIIYFTLLHIPARSEYVFKDIQPPPPRPELCQNREFYHHSSARSEWSEDLQPSVTSSNHLERREDWGILIQIQGPSSTQATTFTTRSSHLHLVIPADPAQSAHSVLRHPRPRISRAIADPC